MSGGDMLPNRLRRRSVQRQPSIKTVAYARQTRDFQPCAQALHLFGEPSRQGQQHVRSLGQDGEPCRPIEGQEFRLGPGDRIAMVAIREERGFGDQITWIGLLENQRLPVRRVAHQADPA